MDLSPQRAEQQSGATPSGVECIIVPHIAIASIKTRCEMSRIAATNLINGIKGERLLTRVNPEVYDKSIYLPLTYRYIKYFRRRP